MSRCLPMENCSLRTRRKAGNRERLESTSRKSEAVQPVCSNCQQQHATCVFFDSVSSACSSAFRASSSRRTDHDDEALPSTVLNSRRSAADDFAMAIPLELSNVDKRSPQKQPGVGLRCGKSFASSFTIAATSVAAASSCTIQNIRRSIGLTDDCPIRNGGARVHQRKPSLFASQPIPINVAPHFTATITPVHANNNAFKGDVPNADSPTPPLVADHLASQIVCDATNRNAYCGLDSVFVDARQPSVSDREEFSLSRENGTLTLIGNVAYPSILVVRPPVLGLQLVEDHLAMIENTEKNSNGKDEPRRGVISRSIPTRTVAQTPTWRGAARGRQSPSASFSYSYSRTGGRMLPSPSRGGYANANPSQFHPCAPAALGLDTPRRSDDISSASTTIRTASASQLTVSHAHVEAVGKGLLDWIRLPETSCLLPPLPPTPTTLGEMTSGERLNALVDRMALAVSLSGARRSTTGKTLRFKPVGSEVDSLESGDEQSDEEASSKAVMLAPFAHGFCARGRPLQVSEPVVHVTLVRAENAFPSCCDGMSMCFSDAQHDAFLMSTQVCVTALPPFFGALERVADGSVGGDECDESLGSVGQLLLEDIALAGVLELEFDSIRQAEAPPANALKKPTATVYDEHPNLQYTSSSSSCARELLRPLGLPQANTDTLGGKPIHVSVSLTSALHNNKKPLPLGAREHCAEFVMSPSEHDVTIAPTTASVPGLSPAPDKTTAAPSPATFDRVGWERGTMTFEREREHFGREDMQFCCVTTEDEAPVDGGRLVDEIGSYGDTHGGTHMFSLLPSLIVADPLIADICALGMQSALNPHVQTAEDPCVSNPLESLRAWESEVSGKLAHEKDRWGTASIDNHVNIDKRPNFEDQKIGLLSPQKNAIEVHTGHASSSFGIIRGPEPVVPTVFLASPAQLDVRDLFVASGPSHPKQTTRFKNVEDNNNNSKSVLKLNNAVLPLKHEAPAVRVSEIISTSIVSARLTARNLTQLQEELEIDAEEAESSHNPSMALIFEWRAKISSLGEEGNRLQNVLELDM